MVAKPIHLGPGLSFPMIEDAKSFFDPIRTKTALGQKLTGSDFDAVKLLYEAYCAKTNWPMPGAVKAIYADEHKRFKTKCFRVEFDDAKGSTTQFSLDTALSKVAG